MMILRILKRSSKGASLLLLLLYIFNIFLPSPISASFGDTITVFSEISDTSETVPCYASGKINISSRLYELLFKKENEKQRLYLIPGGNVFGIRIKEENLTVSSAKDGSPFKKGDKIISVNGEAPESAEDITKALDSTRGGAAKIEIIRGGEKMTLTAMPKCEDGVYKLGITLRSTASGIGTVTFIDTETGIFGGLGHGVCDSDGSELVKIKSAEATGVVLGEIMRGEVGKPGELSGILNKKHLGCITDNNECGVFGVLENQDYTSAKPLPVAFQSEVKAGEAEIISTVKNGKRATYKIEITEICDSGAATKSFKIKVTDPLLITLTGGIVRGMSGSPIIQDGKLVGAVTHVMVANPTEGYGIFIENMLASVPKTLPNAA